MKEVKIYTIVSDQLSPPITGESFCTDMVRHSDYADLEEKCAALAAENSGLKHAMAVTLEHVSVTDAGQAGVAAMIINDALHHGETPATDVFLAEVRASARNEGINYAASRLAAAFNHGFVDKPLAEVCDVVRMILDTKEELANSTLPPADGLSGEYAEKFLAGFAAQLRKGAAL
ncbi:hypothetical protein ABVG49_003377 [Salmonella enterica subsp. enterica]|nr:hypothetical protein [Salmonella enterica]MDL4204532.1 hypothetical protein [Salmonella enterica]